MTAFRPDPMTVVRFVRISGVVFEYSTDVIGGGNGVAGFAESLGVAGDWVGHKLQTMRGLNLNWIGEGGDVCAWAGPYGFALPRARNPNPGLANQGEFIAWSDRLGGTVWDRFGETVAVNGVPITAPGKVVGATIRTSLLGERELLAVVRASTHRDTFHTMPLPDDPATWASQTWTEVGDWDHPGDSGQHETGWRFHPDGDEARCILFAGDADSQIYPRQFKLSGNYGTAPTVSEVAMSVTEGETVHSWGWNMVAGVERSEYEEDTWTGEGIVAVDYAPDGSPVFATFRRSGSRRIEWAGTYPNVGDPKARESRADIDKRSAVLDLGWVEIPIEVHDVTETTNSAYGDEAIPNCYGVRAGTTRYAYPLHIDLRYQKAVWQHRTIDEAGEISFDGELGIDQGTVTRTGDWSEGITYNGAQIVNQDTSQNDSTWVWYLDEFLEYWRVSSTFDAATNSQGDSYTAPESIYTTEKTLLADHLAAVDRSGRLFITSGTYNLIDSIRMNPPQAFAVIEDAASDPLDFMSEAGSYLLASRVSLL